MKIENMLNESQSRGYGHVGSNGSSPGSGKHHLNLYPNVNSFVENSISDILCVSIPEEEEEESKNYTVTITKM